MFAPSSTVRTIELVVVDQRADLLQDVAQRLADSPVHVMAEATNGPAALAAIRRQRPDLVLLGHTRDLGDDDAELARLRREFPRLPILVYSAFDHPLYIAQALLGGAQGYLLHRSPAETFLASITSAAAGESCWTAAQIEPLAGPARETLPTTSWSGIPLTPLEREVLWRVAEGLSDYDIALRLGLPAPTVHGLYRSLRRKLDAMRRLWSRA